MKTSENFIARLVVILFLAFTIYLPASGADNTNQVTGEPVVRIGISEYPGYAYKDENGKMQLCHTLNNTCVAPPRMLIAFLENNLQADGTVRIPQVLRPYMGGKELLVPAKKSNL